MTGEGHAGTTTTITSSVNPTVFGEGGTKLTIAVDPAHSGKVQLCVVGASCGIAFSISSVTGTYTVQIDPNEDKFYYAKYLGTVDYGPSESGVLHQVVGHRPDLQSARRRRACRPDIPSGSLPVFPAAPSRAAP